MDVNAAPDPIAARGPSVLHGVAFAAKAVLAIAFLGELTAIFLNVIARTFFATAFLWADEVAKLVLSTLAFTGGAVAFAHGQHSYVRFILNRLGERAARACLVVSDFLVLLIAAVTATASISLLQSRWSKLTPILQIPATWIVPPLSASMLLLIVYSANRLLAADRATAVITGAILALVLAVALVLRGVWLPPWFSGDAAIFTARALLFVGIFGGLPVGFALILSTMLYLWSSGTVPMVALPQNMVDGTGNFVLLALPFFVFAGLTMERGGISLRLVRFVHALVGHLRGGLLHVMVLSVYLVSGLSGSKTAGVAAVGSVMRDMLKRERYSLSEGAVLAASVAMGETLPPFIAILVLGSITTLSMAALFIGGVIPAAVIAVCLMALIYLRAGRAAHPRAPLHVMATSGVAAILPLMMPVILFARILFGIATPTEVSSFAVVYGLILAILIYREFNCRAFIQTVIDSALLAGMVLFILAAAPGFSWVLTVAQLPQRLVNGLHSINDNTALFLTGSIALLIVIGSLLEGLPALIIPAPLLLPIAGQIGISELHYGTFC
jgi:tripartite ATP-independent transporter DctM subunit